MWRSEQDKLQRVSLRQRRVFIRLAGAHLIAGLLFVVSPFGGGEARAPYEPCTIYEGKDTCLAGDTCTAQDGGQGICIPPPCVEDGDCKKEPLRQCDKRRSPAVCVECYGDLECDAPKICELDPRSFVSNRCVECGIGRSSACMTSDAGRLCVLDRGACGCADHVDCAPSQFCRRSECLARPTSGSGRPGSDGAATDLRGTATTDTGGTPIAGGGNSCSTAQYSSSGEVPLGILVMVLGIVVVTCTCRTSSSRCRRYRRTTRVCKFSPSGRLDFKNNRTVNHTRRGSHLARCADPLHRADRSPR